MKLAKGSFLSFVFVLAACTQESKVKEAAKDSAVRNIEATLTAEAATISEDRRLMRSIYVRILRDRAEVEVGEIKINGSMATAEVTVRTVPDAVRISLREIIAKLNDDRAKNFNIANAVGLITRQLGSAGTLTEQKSVMSLEKRDEWKGPEPEPAKPVEASK